MCHLDIAGNANNIEIPSFEFVLITHYKLLFKLPAAQSQSKGVKNYKNFTKKSLQNRYFSAYNKNVEAMKVGLRNCHSVFVPS